MDETAALVVMLSAMTVMVSCHQICFIGSEYNPKSGTSPRWFLPYNDPCKCTAVRLGGMRIPASSYRQKAPYYLDELFLSEDAGEILAYFNCTSAKKKNTDCSSPEPLGMEDETIPNSHITFSHPRGRGAEARLNNNRGWWFPYRSTSFNCWIEVALVESTVVAGIITQGRPYTNWYVTAYKVMYRQQQSSGYVEDGNGNVKEFSGNTDGNTPVTNMFTESVVATAVRIEPTAWIYRIALRLELLGCRSG